MYMFAMRYRRDHCGGISLESFIDLVRAEGAPIFRAFAATMSDQPALQRLMGRHPDYFRRLPTPVADQAVQETLSTLHKNNVFLGSGFDDNWRTLLPP